MGGVFKSVAKVFGGGKGGSTPNIMQSAAPAPSAPAASAATAAEGASSPTATVGSQTGSLGTEDAKKTGRRRGRLETLLSDLGGTVERFGD